MLGIVMISKQLELSPTVSFTGT